MLGCVHDSTTIWRLWGPVRRRATQASNVRSDEDDTESSGKADTEAPRPTPGRTPRQWLPRLLGPEWVSPFGWKANSLRRPRSATHCLVRQSETWRPRCSWRC